MNIYENLPSNVSGASAVALGMFDGLHRGHMAVLETMSLEAAARGLAPCVFTFSTNEARPNAKSAGHLLSIPERNAIFKKIGVADVFQPEFLDFKDMPPVRFAEDVLLTRLNARFICCGEDFRFGKDAAAGVTDLRDMLPPDVTVKIVPTVFALGGAISTTRIRELIRAGDMDAAKALLGRAFSIDFEVIHGRRLGRTLDAPTINQPFPEDFVIPRFGVYATIAAVDGVRRASVTNVGVKPTVGSDRVLAETYIQGFSGDLYGQNIPVEFVRFLRDERKFSDIDELRRQIQIVNELAAEITHGLV